MKNKLSDLNNHLFEQLERLNDEDLKGEELDKEIRRSQAMGDVAERIIDNANLVFKAAKFNREMYDPRDEEKLPNLLE